MKISKGFVQSTKGHGIWERADRSLMLGDMVLITREPYLKLKRDKGGFADLMTLIKNYSIEGVRAAASGETLGTFIPSDVVDSASHSKFVKVVSDFVEDRIAQIESPPPPKDDNSANAIEHERVIPRDLFSGEIWDEVRKDQAESEKSNSDN